MSTLNNQQLKRLAETAKILGHGDIAVVEKIFDVEDNFAKEIENVREEIPKAVEEIRALIPSVKDGEKGEKGDSIVGPQGVPGKDGQSVVGPQGIPGKDGIDGKPGENGKDGLPGPIGPQGKDGSPDSPKEIKSKLESLQGDNRLSVAAIKGLEDIERLARLNINSLPTTTTFVNGKRAKNINFTGATISYTNDTATVAITSSSGGAPGGNNGNLQYRVNATTLGGMVDSFYSPSAASLPGASHQLTFGRSTVFQSDNDLSDSVSILYINNGKMWFADDNQSGLVTGRIGQTDDSTGDVEFVNPHGGWRVTSGNVGIRTTKAATYPLQIGDGSALTVPTAPTSGSGFIPGYGGSFGGYNTTGSGSSGYQVTTTIHIYAFNTDGIGNYMFSPDYLTLSVTDDGISGSYGIDWSWDDTGASGYRVLVQNSTYGYTFNYYYDHTMSGSITDFLDSNTWTFGSTVTPNANLEKFFVTTAGVGYFKSNLLVDGTFTSTGKITAKAATNNILGKLAIGTTATPATMLVVGAYTGGGTADGQYPSYSNQTLNSPYGHQLTFSDGWHGNSSEGSGYWVYDAGSDGGFGSHAFLSNNNQVATFVSKNSSQCVFQFASTVYNGYLGIDGSGNVIIKGGAGGAQTVIAGGYGSFFPFQAGNTGGSKTFDTNALTLTGTWSATGLSIGTSKVTSFNGVTTAGYGVPAIYKAGRSIAQTAAVASVAAYTVGSADGSFEVSANVLVTTATTHSFTVTCAYTDEGNTARTITLNFQNVGGTIGTTIANVGGAVPYEGIPLHIRCKASTTITIATTGTFTAITYNVEGIIKQLS